MQIRYRNLQDQIFIAVLISFALGGCHSKPKNSTADKVQMADSTKMGDTLTCCSCNLPARPFLQATDTTQNKSESSANSSRDEMSYIPGGSFVMGGDSIWGRPDEFPRHNVTVSAFYIDKHEVTNAQFRAFVEATQYVTTAERKPDWEEIRKQLPAGTLKPADSLLVASSLVFSPPNHAVSLNNASVWWNWEAGADWRHPQGKKSNIEGKDNYPVVQVSWDDANAYAKWAGKRLPTEA